MAKRSRFGWPWGRKAGNGTAGAESVDEFLDESRWAEVRGLTLHYRVVGRPGGAPLVMLHGLLGHAREWDPAVAELAVGHEVWVLDQRGHGLSDWAGDYSRSTMADDLIAWLEATGLERPVVIGHSMGATVALLAAARRPELFERLVIADTAPKTADGELQSWLREYLEELGTSSYGTISEAFALRSGGPRARPELARRSVEQSLVRGDDGRYRWRFDAQGLVGSLDSVNPSVLWEAIDAISCPVLLLRGEHSLELSAELAEEMARRLGDARLGTIAGAGHDLALENPEGVARAVLDYLAEG